MSAVLNTRTMFLTAPKAVRGRSSGVQSAVKLLCGYVPDYPGTVRGRWGKGAVRSV